MIAFQTPYEPRNHSLTHNQQLESAEIIRTALQSGLGKRFIKLYHYNETPIGGQQCLQHLRWLAVVADTEAIHQAREYLLALQPHLTNVPAIVPAHAVRTYFQLNPLIGQQVSPHDEYYVSAPNVPVEQQITPIALLALNASGMLFHGQSADKQNKAALDSLTCAYNLYHHDTVAQTLDNVYTTLNRYLTSRSIAGSHPDAPPCLPNLQSIFEELDTAILVLPDEANLSVIDWEAVAAWYAPQYTCLYVTTITQLQLLAQYDMAVDFEIGRYNHCWGINPLSNIHISKKRLIKNALQNIIELSINHLSRYYLIFPDTHLRELFHDLQNQFLKIQLQYELLCMELDLPRTNSPRLDTDRNLSTIARVDAIISYIEQWIDCYTQLLHHCD